MHNSIHTCKQMGLDADFKEAKVPLESIDLDLDIVTSEHSSKKKGTKKQNDFAF